MNEDKINKESIDFENQKILKLVENLEKLKNKKSKFLFCVPPVETPSALIYEIYFHATIVKEMGYDVIMLVENKEQTAPDWIESNLVDFKHIPMDDTKRLSVSVCDFMIIPETFTNIMEQTKKLPCTRIGFLQSIDYMLNALLPGMDWSSFGIRDVITTSKTLENFINKNYKNKFNIKSYKLGIPDYFKRTDDLQKPTIAIVGRNQNEISKIVKLFFSKYPQYSWISFDPLLTKSKPPQYMARPYFAERLRESFAAIWIDRISSFGTFPLECMKSGVIPISLNPDITPDYIISDENEDSIKIKENVGIWTYDFYQIPDIIANLLVKYLDDSIENSYYDGMEESVSEYTQENSKKQIVTIYNDYISQKIEYLENILNELNNGNN